MSEILQIFGKAPRAWIILDCGHWYKWTGKTLTQKPGDTFSCPNCEPVTVSELVSP